MSRLEQLLQIMQRLRDPRTGCPWDRQQSFASIAPSTLEEAYEVVDAIERGEQGATLRDELGDLLFQVVFHAQMADELGSFDFDAVAGAICDKLVRRHPHVFGDASAPDAAGQSLQWEALKSQERVAAAGGRVPSELEGVARALPALTRAVKLSRRAARVGFDWQEPRQTADKVAEELAEVLEASAERDPPGAEAGSGRVSAHLFEEVGDLLFAVANLARKLEVDPERALRAANSKFERRFRHIERSLLKAGENIHETPLARLEALWEEAKRQEGPAQGASLNSG